MSDPIKLPPGDSPPPPRPCGGQHGNRNAFKQGFYARAQVECNAASRLAFQETGEWVLVMGNGLIGQSAAQAAHARVARVILAGRRSFRLHLDKRVTHLASPASAPEMYALNRKKSPDLFGVACQW